MAPRFLPVLMNSRSHLDHIADRLTDSGRMTGPVVIVGHSAGAAAGSWIAPRLVEGGVDVCGLVYVDGNDSPNHLIEKAWPRLESLPIRAVMAPPSPCNRDGQLTQLLESRRPGSVEIIPGAGHGDIEMLGAAVYRRVCKDTTGVEEWHVVQAAVVRAIEWILRAA